AGGIASCWGQETQASFGNGTAGGSSTPSQVLTNELFQLITIGSQFGCGLNGTNDAFCWGYNVVGAVGDGGGGSIAANRSTPVRVAGNLKFDHISAGY